MSQKAYVEFYEKYLPSPAAAGVVTQLKSAKSEDDYGAVVLAAGRAAGYDFTLDEARTVMKNSQKKLEQAQAGGQLSKEQLDAAVGGALSTVTTVKLGSPTLSTSALRAVAGDTIMCPW